MMGKVILAVMTLGILLMVIGILIAGRASIDAVGSLFTIGLIVFVLGIALYVIRAVVRKILS